MGFNTSLRLSIFSKLTWSLNGSTNNDVVSRYLNESASQSLSLYFETKKAAATTNESLLINYFITKNKTKEVI